MESRKQKLIIIGALCLVVTLISVGYAMISASLKISGTAKVESAKWEVKFVKGKDTTTKKGKATCSIGTIADTSITGLSATFQVPGDQCVFTVPIENAGTLDANLVDVIGRSNALSFDGNQDDISKISSWITYDVSYGDTKIDSLTNFDNIDTLEPGERETVTLRITFSIDATDVPSEAVTIGNMDRTFNFQNKVGSSSVSPTPDTTPVFNDTSGANAPVLSGDMIPVVYDETKKQWVKQDLDKSYDYSQQVWANAVTVVEDGIQTRSYYKKAKAGTVISMSDINTMWVWIPRYSYTIQGTYGKDGTGAATPGEIEVKFVGAGTTDTGSATYTEGEATGWRTSGAFNFGGEDKAGIWVSKFEPTGSAPVCTTADCDISKVTVKPGIASIRNKTVSDFFYMARSMQKASNPYGFSTDSGDLHLSKDLEWTSVSYLSQSKYGKYGNSNYSGANKEVYMNNNSSYITGTSSGLPTASSSSAIAYTYNDMKDLGDVKGLAGPGASTSGTIYGIYDYNGGAWERTMVFMYYDAQGNNDHPDRLAVGPTGFKGLSSTGTETGTLDLPDPKYYNTFRSANPASNSWASAKAELACDGGVCYGQALSETGGWYGDYKEFASLAGPSLDRGGTHSYSAVSGVFAVSDAGSGAGSGGSCRLVLAP